MMKKIHTFKIKPRLTEETLLISASEEVTTGAQTTEDNDECVFSYSVFVLFVV